MITLALETSTDLCSVALAYADTLRVRNTDGTQQGSRLILPLIDELMLESGLTPSALQRLVWSHGPGSFTGLRIGAAVMQGMAAVLQLPVTGLSSLYVLAQTVTQEMQLPADTHIVVAMDARMGDWYVGNYSVTGTGVVQCLHPDRLLPATEWQALSAAVDGAAVVLAGAVWTGLHLAAFPAGSTLAAVHIPAASALLSLVGSCDGSLCMTDVEPVYLRDANIWKKHSEHGKPFGGK